MVAEAVVPAWTDGRIFWAAGATHTEAAEAEPAESRAARRVNVFTKASLVGGPTQGACRFFHECTGGPCADLSAGGEDGVLGGRCPTGRHKWGCVRHRARFGLLLRLEKPFALSGRERARLPVESADRRAL